MDRKDITNWLIHFTKDISAENELDVFLSNEYLEIDKGEQELDMTNQYPYGIFKYSAFEVLKIILLECGIRYGYSFRNHKTTLYGGEPVICFTEMPIKSLIDYAKKRNSESNSSIGIAIKKSDAYKYGARPVIYGLAQSQSTKYEVNTDTCRIIKASIFPLAEQFRLVPLNLDGKQKIDWTHEREWRIKRRNDIMHHAYVVLGYETAEIEHLNIFEEEGHCEDIIVIVGDNAQANEVYDLILTLLDGSSNQYDVSFSPKSISILIINNIKNDNSIKVIEDLDSDSFFKVELPQLTEEFIQFIDKTIKHGKDVVSKEATDEYLKRNANNLDKTYNDFIDSCGYCDIRSFKPRNKYIRAMLKLGVATSYGESYAIDAVGVHFLSQSLCFHEFITNKVCLYLNQEFDNIFLVNSYLD